MGIIRNSIEILGITPQEELPEKIADQALEYSETETIFIPQDKPGIQNIFQIVVEIEIKSKKMIHVPQGVVVVLNGLKKYKILYGEKQHFQKAYILNLETPFNTFIELPEGEESIDKIKLYILDAYFDLIDSKKIYSYMIYLIDVQYYREKKDTSNYIIHDDNFSCYEDKSSEVNAQTEVEIPLSEGKREMALTDHKTGQEDIGSSKKCYIDLEEEYL